MSNDAVLYWKGGKEDFPLWGRNVAPLFWFALVRPETLSGAWASEVRADFSGDEGGVPTIVIPWSEAEANLSAAERRALQRAPSLAAELSDWARAVRATVARNGTTALHVDLDAYASFFKGNDPAGAEQFLAEVLEKAELWHGDRPAEPIVAANATLDRRGQRFVGPPWLPAAAQPEHDGQYQQPQARQTAWERFRKDCRWYHWPGAVMIVVGIGILSGRAVGGDAWTWPGAAMAVLLAAAGLAAWGGLARRRR